MFAKIIVRMFVRVLFLCCLAATSAYAGGGEATWIYTDSWVDDETSFPENGVIYIVGSGVMEFPPLSLGHSADMRVTVTSPQGQSNNGVATWYQGSSGASVVVSLI